MDLRVKITVSFALIFIFTPNKIGSQELGLIRKFAVINNDHGIISDADLKESGRGFLAPTPFDGTNPTYPYWQCFDRKSVRSTCSLRAPRVKTISSFGLEVRLNSARHDYSLAHAVSGEVCGEMLETWRKISKGQDFVCINGTNDSFHQTRANKEYEWSFLRLKTRAGYLHFIQPEP